MKQEQTPLVVKHMWTEHEKQINCKICLLATNLKDCKNCPFYGLHTPTNKGK